LRAGQIHGAIHTHLKRAAGVVFVHWSGKPYESTLAFDPVDVSDPDRPALLPSFALPGDFLLDGYFVSGSRIYVTERAGTSLVGSFADFSALDQPTHSTRREVPGQVVAAAQETVYTSTASASGLTLSRLDWQAETAPLTAAHEWSGRRLAKVLLDDSTQRLYVVHATSNSATGGPSSHLDWHHLDILDAETLAVLSSIELDNFSSPPPTLHLSGGTLDIQLPYFAVLHVDIRNPSEPKVLGATSLYN